MEFEEFNNRLKEARQGRTLEKKSIFTDMNAMVDIAFLLLTFFLLTTTMLKPKVIELVMPVPDQQDAPVQTQTIKESRALTLIPLPDDQLAYYRGFSQAEATYVEYGAEGIRKLLSQFVADTEEPIVLLKPHPESAFENLVDLLDELSLSGVERYTIDAFGEADRLILTQAEIPH